jgi:Fe2+ or Zn2+ uptake regulation protein
MVMTNPSALPPEHPGRLREAGLRVTSPRLAVLAALPDHHHLDVDTIARTARDRLGSLSTQAVYDILRALTDAGLVRRIEPAGSPALYETRVGDNHHHVVCRSCGSTADVDCAVGERPCLTPSNASGFALDEAEITFWGLCPACQSTPSTRIAPGRNAS